MAYKKCVIASNIPGNCDVIRNLDNGMLVNPSDPMDLADKINLLILNDRLRETMGNSARADVELKYDLTKIVRDTLNVYMECI